MIPAADFIGWTGTSCSASPGVLHDLNVYSQYAGWRFTVHRKAGFTSAREWNANVSGTCGRDPRQNVW